MMQDMLSGAKEITLAIGSVENGFMTILTIHYGEGREPAQHRSREVFATREAAKQWGEKKIVPVLELLQLMLSAREVSKDPDRPQGLECTQFENVDGKRVYCRQPAKWHATMPGGLGPDEFCCDVHAAEFRALGPQAEARMRRIN